VTAADITQWQRAEATLGRPRAVARAAGQSSPRVGWILRGMSALDGGDRAGVARVAELAREAGCGEVAAVLEVAAAAPATLNPTAIRKAAKRAGLGAGMGLPYLDLLRLFAAHRAGARTIKSPALRTCERQRAVLRAVLHALSTTSDANYIWHTLERLSVRLGQILAVVRILDEDRVPTEAFLQRSYQSVLLDIDSERWPDIGRSGQLIGAWAEGTGAWRGLSAERVLQDLSRKEQARVLTLLLQGLERRIVYGDGAIPGLAEPAGLAALLARRRGDRPLAALLDTLTQKLTWLEGGTASMEMLRVVLPRARGPAETREIGRRVCEMEAAPPRDLARAWLLHALCDHELEDACEILEEGGAGDLSASDLDAILAEVPPERRPWLQASRALGLGNARSVLDGFSLLASADPERAAALLARTLIELPAGRAGSRKERAIARGLVAALEALAAATTESWGPLVLGALGDRPWPPEAADLLALLAGRAVAGASPLAQAVILVAAERAEASQRVQALLRQIGRDLARMRPAERAEEHGLLLVGWVHVALEPPDVAPLTRFLVRRGPAALTAAAERLQAFTDPSEPAVLGLTRWWRKTEGVGPLPESLGMLSSLMRRSDAAGGATAMIESLADMMRGELSPAVVAEIGPLLDILEEMKAGEDGW